MGCGQVGAWFLANLPNCRFANIDGYGKKPVLRKFVNSMTLKIDSATVIAASETTEYTIFKSDANPTGLPAGFSIVAREVVNPIRGCQVLLVAGYQMVNTAGYEVTGANSLLGLLKGRSFIRYNENAPPVYETATMQHVGCEQCEVLGTAVGASSTVGTVRVFPGDVLGNPNLAKSLVAAFNDVRRFSITVPIAVTPREDVFLTVLEYGWVVGTDGSSCVLTGEVAPGDGPTCDDISAQPDADITSISR